MIKCLIAVLLVLVGSCGHGTTTAPKILSPWPQLSSHLSNVGDGKRDAAVVVAIAHYQFLATVKGATDNALDWEQYFVNIRGIAQERVHMLLNNDATDYSIGRAVQAAAKEVSPGGKLWFVFIGHGAPTEDGADGLLVTVDAQQTVAGLQSRSVKHTQLLSWLSETQGQPIAVLDTCYSGRTPAGDSLIGVQPSRPVKSAAPEQVLILTAARHDQFAGPLPGAERPAFSYLLLGALRGWGDANTDGQVSASEAVDYTRRTLARLVHGNRGQEPTISGSGGALPLSLGRDQGPDLEQVRRAIDDGVPYEFEWRQTAVSGAAASGPALALEAEPAERKAEVDVKAYVATQPQPYALIRAPADLAEQQVTAEELSAQASRTSGEEQAELARRVFPMAKTLFLSQCKGAQAGPGGSKAYIMARDAAMAMNDETEVERLSLTLKKQLCTFGAKSSVASVDCRDEANSGAPWCVARRDLFELSNQRALTTYSKAKEVSEDKERQAIWIAAAKMMVAAADSMPDHPGAPKALLTAGSAYFDAEDFVASLAVYRRIVKDLEARKAPTPAKQSEQDDILIEAYDMRATSTQRLFDYEEAVKLHEQTYAKAVSLPRTEMVTSCQCAASYRALKLQALLQEIVDAERLALRAIKDCSPKDHDLAFEIALLPFKKGKWAKAQTDLRAFIARFQGNRGASVQIVEAYAKIVESKRAAGQTKELAAALRDVTAAFARYEFYPESESARLAAKAQLELADIQAAAQKPLVIDLSHATTSQEFAERAQAQYRANLKRVQAELYSYNPVFQYKIPETSIAAYTRKARVCQRFADALYESEKALPAETVKKLAKLPDSAKDTMDSAFREGAIPALDQYASGLECPAIGSFGRAIRLAIAEKREPLSREARMRVSAYGQARIAECMADEMTRDTTLGAYQPNEFTWVAPGITRLLDNNEFRDDRETGPALAMLRKDGKSVPAVNRLVRVALRWGNLALAEDLLDRSQLFEGSDAEADYLFGVVMDQKERVADSYMLYHWALNRDPNHTMSLTRLGLTMLDRGHYKEAVERLEKVVAVLPDNPWAHLNLADAYRSAQDWKRAKASYEKVQSFRGKIGYVPDETFANYASSYGLGLLFLAAGDQLPDTSELQTLETAKMWMLKYREIRGADMAGDDPSNFYLAQIEQRQEQARIQQARNQSDPAAAVAR